MTPKRRKRLSPAQKQTRAFLKERISFHLKAASTETQVRSLKKWHLTRAAGLNKEKEKIFPKSGSKEK